MPGTDPAMPAVRACPCGEQAVAGLSTCVTHASVAGVMATYLQLLGLQAATSDDNRKLRFALEVARVADRDTREEIAQLRAELAELRAMCEPPSTQQAPILAKE